MVDVPELAISAAWVVWIVSWLLAAAWSRRTVSRAGRRAEGPHLALTAAGFVLVLWSRPRGDAPSLVSIILARAGYEPLRLWSASTGWRWAMFGLVVLGFLFCWWARLHLGRLWSGTVARKADHRIVDTGPYRLVRHPIYTGLILAVAATALVNGTAPALAGVVLFVAGLWTKARLEERFLRAELGAEAYDSYAAHTPMLIPHPASGRSRS